VARPSYWPAGPNYYRAPTQRPPFPTNPPALRPYRSWGQIQPTTVWLEAGQVMRPGDQHLLPPGMRGAGWPCDAGAGDESYFRELAAQGGTPNEALPYLQAGQWPPTPGSPAYERDIRPQFIDRMDEQHYIDWFYSHFTTDAPRYEIPAPGRQPRHIPPTEPVTVTTVGEPVETTTVTEGPEETGDESKPPWGWIIGGSAAAILVVGGIAYAVTRPRRRKG
jgi:hypothetical protein